MRRQNRRQRRRKQLRFQLLESRLLLAEDAFEPNNSIAEVDVATATANFGLLTGTYVQSPLALEDSGDYFRFETAVTGTSHDFVQIEFEHDDGDLHLELFDASGQQIDRSASTSKDLERVELAGRPAGVYFVRIFGRSGAVNPKYALTINPPGNSPDDFYEPNDNLTEVDAQSASGTSSPNLGVLGEPIQVSNLRLEDSADWFRFQTTASGTSEHFARIEFDNDRGDLQLELYDSQGARLRRSTSNNDDHEQVSLAGDPAGIYYIHIFGRNGVANPNYALTVVPPSSTAADQPEIELRVGGSLLISGQQDSVTFGEVAQSQTGPELTFDVVNRGAVPLHLENLTIPSGFTLVDTPSTSIAAGQSGPFTVRLDSVTPGTRLGEVRFASNDRDESEFTFWVRGTVTPTTNVASGDIFEENDDRFEVLAQSAGGSDSANLGVLRDTFVLPGLELLDDDWFRFETMDHGTARDYVQIDFENDDGNLHLELFDEFGNLVDSSRSDIDDLERVELAAQPPGIYFARVYGDGGAVNADYALTIDPPANSPDDYYESNEDRFQVDLHPRGDISSPNFGELTDRIQISNLRLEDSADWFRFETTVSGTADDFARIEFDNQLGNLHLELYDAYGNLLDPSRSDIDDHEQVSLASYPAGVYYVRVYGNGGDANADYALTIMPPSAVPADRPEVLVQVDSTILVSGQRDPVSLGSIAQGTSNADLVFLVYNLGQAPLLTENLSVPAGFSIVEPLDSQIPVGQSDSFLVRLESEALGSRFGELRFATNDLDESEFVFPIAGTVTPTLAGTASDIFEENDDRFTVLNEQPGAADSANLGVLLEALQLRNQQLLDDDWFRFETTATGTTHDLVQIDFDSSVGNLDLELYDGSGQRIGRSTNGFADFEQIGLADRVKGVYFVRVYGKDGAVNAIYSITINPPGDTLDDPFEPNGDRFVVDLQVPGETHSANLGVLGQQRQILDLRLEDQSDWFRFETTSFGTTDHFVRIDFQRSQGELDLEMFDADGNRIGRSTLNQNYDELSLANRSAGVFYARVYGRNGAANPDYTLTVNPPVSPDVITLAVSPDRVDEAEGSMAATGTVIRSGDTGDDLTVYLATSDFSEARVPTQVVIPQGLAQQSFTIAAIDDDLRDGTQIVQLTAWADQYVTGTASLSVTDSGDVNLPPNISEISDVTISRNSTAGPLVFTVSDDVTPAESLTVTAQSDNQPLIENANITIQESENGRTISLSPVPDRGGTATITILVSDAEGLSASESFVVTVTPFNARPSFTATDPPPVREDSGLQTVSQFATFNAGASDELGQSVIAYLVSEVSNATLFAQLPSIDNAGNLTYEPAADAFGESTFVVAVQDDGGTEGESIDISESKTFTIKVNSVNDPPTFIAVDPPPVLAGSGPKSVAFVTAFDPGPADEADQTVVAYNVSNIGDTALFADLPAIDSEGNLTYTPATDVFGTSTFDVAVQDSGGAANGGVDTSLTQTFTITVTGVTTDPVVNISPTGPNGAPDPNDLPSGPQPTSWAQQRSDLREIVIDLSAPITSVSASDLVLTNLGVNVLADPDLVVPLSDSQLTLSNGGVTLTISFAANQLEDGVYQLDLLSAITGGATFTFTGDATNKFFVLTGDWNGSGGVNIQDFATFAYWFANLVPLAPDYIDVNDSDGINIQDFAGFAANFGKGIEFLPGTTAPLNAGDSGGEGELASALRTFANPTDVNGDGSITARDALNVMNAIDRVDGELGLSRFDANGDGRVTSADALFVINRLPEEPVISSEQPRETVRFDAVDHLLSDQEFVNDLF